MNNKKLSFGPAVLTLIAGLVSTAAAQQPIYKAPTSSDWTALAKLPDFSGVWERGGGGGGGGGGQRASQAPAGERGAAPQAAAAGQRRGGTAVPAGPSLTPQYEAMRRAAASAPQPEDN